MMQATSSDELGTADLIERSMKDARELIHLEIALAKDELRRDFVAAKSAAVMSATAIVLALMGLISLVAAFGLALGPLRALAIGLVLLAVAGVLGFAAFRRLPKRPMSSTARRLKDEQRLLHEHLS